MATSSARIVVADDEALTRWSLAQRLRMDGHDVEEAGTGGEMFEIVRGGGVGLVLLDDRLPDAYGLAALRAIKELDADVPAILLSASARIETVIEGMKAGAFHVARKPFDLDDIAFLVSRALEATELRREVRRLRASQASPYPIDAIVGGSAVMEMLRSLVARVAMSPAPLVLLTGECGTGKDLAASVLHFNSDRANSPFMKVSCLEMPEAVLASELFGQESGGRADAIEHKRGLFELAHGGTVFLDDIGEAAPALQARLLHLLDHRSLRRVGGIEDIEVDVRIIAATNRTLDDDVKAGRFRQELFSRLNMLPVLLPPLRHHTEDVPTLVAYYVDRFNSELHRDVKGASPAALEVLCAYRWPGNVRELRNAVERAVLVAAGDWLQPCDFPVTLRANDVPLGRSDFPLPERGLNLDTLEQSLVTQALDRCGGNQTRAAGLLGMNRDQIRYRIEKYGLPRPQHA